MPVAINIDSYQSEVVQIVEDVFRTMLSLDMKPLPGSSSAAPGTLTAAVQFAGEWKGAVLLQCSPGQALVVTSRLIPGLVSVKVDADVRDALGELANMLGGNLKSVLPSGVALSMPTVVEGSDYALHVCGGNASKTLGFSSALGLFWVTLVQMLDKEVR